MSFDFLNNPNLFSYNPMSWLVGGFACLFFVLVVIYSLRFMKGRKGLFKYYLYTFLTLVFSLGVIFANNLMLLLVFWGFLGLLLYLLIGYSKSEGAPAAARKALVIIGGTDVLLLLGIVLVWLLTAGPDSGLAGLFGLKISALTIPLAGRAAVVAYLCLAAAAFAKAGAMPFHTWVPDVAEDAPIPVTAYIPATLDKLVGIFFLARISTELFILTPSMNQILMGLGSLTIIATVMMALVQHDFKRMLGYNAVSQVGYMILGIGTANPIGIAGAIFHMFNHTLYDANLFFAAGVVEKKTGTTNLNHLGGLVKAMPLVFVAFLVGAFAISGVPPFNGFASKWMIYQGIIASSGGWLKIVWLFAAMVGSALTLACFMKLTHAVFLGQPSRFVQKAVAKHPGKTGFSMGFPLVLLSTLCIGIGVAAWKLPLSDWFRPMIEGGIDLNGIWGSGMATVMMISAFVIGLLVYLAGTLRKARTSDIFIGGEDPTKHPEMRVSGVDFFATIRNLGFLKGIYRAAEKKFFDIYVVGFKFIGGLGGMISELHNGLLSRYIVWCLAGIVVLYIALIG
jgi:NADH:ubiquinone oxidoreductase subunit 5 (subunit L)/multisubunit Na+/H+ antiporter MnhA subunit